MAIDLSNLEKSAPRKNAGSAKPAATHFSLKSLNIELSRSSRLLSDKWKEWFFSELNTLSQSGVDIRYALEIIKNECKKKVEAEAIATLHRQLITGDTISHAIRQTSAFSELDCGVVRVGEETGKLEEALEFLSDYYGKKIKQRRMLISSLSYPVLVFITALVAVSFMLKVIVPMFEDFFARLHGELPALTQMVIRVSNNFGIIFWSLFLTVLGVLLFYRQFKSQPWFRKRYSALLLKLPFVGPIVQKTYLVRFCRLMHLALSSKVPVMESIDLIRGVIKFYPFEVAMDSIQRGILAGKPLYVCMAASPVFGDRLVALIRVGEEVNKVDTMFGKVADQLSDELELRLKLFGGVLEPLLIVLVGGLVAVILISMYLPMFKLGSWVG